MPDQGPPYSPYGLEAADDIYNVLFCDDPKAFAPRPGETPADWQATLYTEPVSPNGVRALTVELLGVIVKVPLDGGPDTLAAFADEGVRCINHDSMAGPVLEAASALLQRVVATTTR